MRLSAYVPLATRTESVLDPATLTPQQKEAIRAIRVLLEYEVVQIGAKLDRLKRIAFYGKDMSMLDGTHASLVGRPLRDESPLNERGLRLLHAITGLVTETAELAEALTHRDPGAPIDPVNLAEEIGDVQWYAAVLTDAVEANADRVLEANLAKLKERYPEKFDAERAVERDLENERETLQATMTASFEERLATVLRAIYGGMVPDTLPIDLASQSPLPPAMVQDLLSRSVQSTLDRWIDEAIPLLRLSLSEMDLANLEDRPARTEEEKARAKLLSLLGRYGLNARFNALLEAEVSSGAARLAETLHPLTGAIAES